MDVDDSVVAAEFNCCGVCEEEEEDEAVAQGVVDVLCLLLIWRVSPRCERHTLLQCEHFIPFGFSTVTISFSKSKLAKIASNSLSEKKSATSVPEFDAILKNLCPLCTAVFFD